MEQPANCKRRSQAMVQRYLIPAQLTSALAMNVYL